MKKEIKCKIINLPDTEEEMWTNKEEHDNNRLSYF